MFCGNHEPGQNTDQRDLVIHDLDRMRPTYALGASGGHLSQLDALPFPTTAAVEGGRGWSHMKCSDSPQDTICSYLMRQSVTSTPGRCSHFTDAYSFAGSCMVAFGSIQMIGVTLIPLQDLCQKGRRRLIYAIEAHKRHIRPVELPVSADFRWHHPHPRRPRRLKARHTISLLARATATH